MSLYVARLFANYKLDDIVRLELSDLRSDLRLDLTNGTNFQNDIPPPLTSQAIKIQ